MIACVLLFSYFATLQTQTVFSYPKTLFSTHKYYFLHKNFVNCIKLLDHLCLWAHINIDFRKLHFQKCKLNNMAQNYDYNDSSKTSLPFLETELYLRRELGTEQLISLTTERSHIMLN